MNLLVVGGTGFIGAGVVRNLVARGHRVAVLHRGQTPGELPDGVQDLHGDRARLDALAKALRTFAPDVVLDMIAYSAADAHSLIDAVRGRAGRLVCVSSMDVYQNYGGFCRLENAPLAPVPMNEDAPRRTSRFPYRDAATGPDDMFYHYDKIPVEDAVMTAAPLAGTVLRLPMVYGPNDKQHRLRGYLEQMDAGRDIELDSAQADWRCTRGYVENVAAAIAAAVTDERATGQIYNLGESDALTEQEWIEVVGRAAGWRGSVNRVRFAEPSPYDWRYGLAASTDHFRSALNFHDPLPRDEALRRTIIWERSTSNNRSRVANQRFCANILSEAICNGAK